MSGEDSVSTSEGRWRVQRDALDEVIGVVRSRLSELFPDVDVQVVLEPDSEPPEGSVWHWHVTFTLGDRSLEAILDVDGKEFYFEDGQGYFEDKIEVTEVAEYIGTKM